MEKVRRSRTSIRTRRRSSRSRLDRAAFWIGLSLPADQVAWADHLARFRWAFFCTMTFRVSLSEERAMERTRVWVRRLEQRNQGGVQAFVATERGRLGRVHVHALVDADGLTCREVKAAWTNGHSQVRRFDPDLDGAAYVAQAAANDCYEVFGSPRRLADLRSES